MRASVLAFAAIGIFSAIDVTPAAAYTTYPYCMRTRYDTDDCSYPSYEACAFTARGLGTSCFANPALAYARRPQPYVNGPQPYYRYRRDY
jgi:hypothetical protein